MKIIKLKGKKCYLSPFIPEDAQTFSKWFNDIEIGMLLGDELCRPSSAETELEMITHSLKNRNHFFSIRDNETNDLIGRILLFDVDHIDQRGMVGLVIGEKMNWNKGYGKDAMILMLDYGFSVLNLNNIMLGVFDFNKRAHKLYQSMGFKEIGRRREGRIIAGKKYDVILMDMLAKEFTSKYIASIVSKYTSSDKEVL